MFHRFEAGFWLLLTIVGNYSSSVRRFLFAALFLYSGGGLSAGDYLVIYRQRVSGNATPSVMECDSVQVFPGYSKLITKGGPTFEVKKGALIATVPRKEYAKLSAYAAEYPSLQGQFEEVRARWESGILESARKKLEAEKMFAESISKGDRIRTLDGQEFQGLIKASGQYSLAITSTDGVTSVGIAQLSARDLKKWDKSDRTDDPRFWYERTLAVLKAREAGIDVAAESKEAESHYPESSRYLAEMDRAREHRRAAALERIAAFSEPAAAPVIQLKTQEDIDELIRMSKLGYTPVLDEATGQIFFSAPVDREQQLRDAMQVEGIPES